MNCQLVTYPMNYVITVESSVAMQPDTFQIVKVTHISMTTNEFTVRIIHTLLPTN